MLNAPSPCVFESVLVLFLNGLQALWHICGTSLKQQLMLSDSCIKEAHLWRLFHWKKKTDFILDWPSVTLMRCFLNSILLKVERHKFIALSVKSALNLYCIFEMTSRAVRRLFRFFFPLWYWKKYPLSFSFSHKSANRKACD